MSQNLLFRGVTARVRHGVRSAPSAATKSEGSGSRRTVETALVEIKLKPPSITHWAAELSSSWPVHVDVLSCKPLLGSKSLCVQLFRVTCTPEDISAVRRFLRHGARSTRLSWVEAGRTQLLVWSLSPLPAPCRAALLGMACCTQCYLQSPPTSVGHCAWAVMFPQTRDADSLGLAMRILGESGAVVDAISRPSNRTRSKLRSPTLRQLQALDMGVSLGYFSIPRRATLSDMARVLGVSRSASAELLRRGTARLVFMASHHFSPL